MASEYETVADIVKELRGIKGGQHTNGGLSFERWRARCQFADDYADRIEAAAKREREAGAEAAQVCGETGEMIGREATREKSSRVGNSAKLREACEALMSEIGGYLTDGLEVIWCSISGKTIKKARAALSDNPRNCDVGTAEEQEGRFEEFCDAHKYVGDDGANVCSQDCPCYGKLDCGVRWAQMPYEEGDVK